MHDGWEGQVATRFGELVVMSPISLQKGRHVAKRAVHSTFGNMFT